MDLVLTEILSKVSFVVYSSHQKDEPKKEFNMVQVPTVLLDGGLRILKRANIHCLQGKPRSRILNIQSQLLTACEFTN